MTRYLFQCRSHVLESLRDCGALDGLLCVAYAESSQSDGRDGSQSRQGWVSQLSEHYENAGYHIPAASMRPQLCPAKEESTWAANKRILTKFYASSENPGKIATVDKILEVYTVRAARVV